MKTKTFLLFLLLMATYLVCGSIFCSCTKDDVEETPPATVTPPSGNITEEKDTYNAFPSNLDGITIIMKRNNDIYLSVTHFKDGAVVNSHTVDYTKYPPKYTYKKINAKTASYLLDVTKKTYIPYYGTEIYSKFKFDYKLTLDPFANKGTFLGYETNAYGETTQKTGTFEIIRD